ncbi:hypothetical protein APX80_22010 [Escherichia coli]|nr:hypothetical protein [Escherichia coli]EFI8923659.1 hypothetical protein [Escherichia coli]EFO1767985.1 hypothetical protein [Escherichia coli]EFO1948823.1 hypothetical protein [Escherichia coli]EFO1963897.1 hypothetical protein [Escherichia coli]
MHLKYVQNPHSVTLIFLTRKKRGNNQYLSPLHNCRIINYKNKNSGFIYMITCNITEKYFEMKPFC